MCHEHNLGICRHYCINDSNNGIRNRPAMKRNLISSPYSQGCYAPNEKPL
jgi:hypothetical protein